MTIAGQVHLDSLKCVLRAPLPWRATRDLQCELWDGDAVVQTTTIDQRPKVMAC